MKAKRRKLNKGFSLVEMLVVVAIIAILSAIAVPKFEKYRAQAIRSEANANLANINTLMHLHYGENYTFVVPGMDLMTIGFDNTNMNLKYSYAITMQSVSAFTVRATAMDKLCPTDSDMDQWQVDETGFIDVVAGMNGYDGC